MAVAWYVIRSKPNKEEFLFEQLTAYGIKVFYPRIRVKTINPRARKLKAYFPSYLFVYVDLEQFSASTLHWMPGAMNLVSFDGTPAPVPEMLITTIERQVERIKTSQKNIISGLKPGEVVLIQDGPFTGYEVIFDGQIAGSARVRVLLTYLQNRQMPLELRENEIQRPKRS